MAINNITPPLSRPGVTEIQDRTKNSPQTTNSAPTTSFDQVLDSLSKTQNNSDALMQKLAAGEEVDLHQVMIASEQTDISFRVALAIRDRLVDSYREVMRMSV